MATETQYSKLNKHIDLKKNLPLIARREIRNNFSRRNERTSIDEGFYSRDRLIRRGRIREWIEVFRVANNPHVAEYVYQRLQGSKIFAEDELRNRVIIASLDYSRGKVVKSI